MKLTAFLQQSLLLGTLLSVSLACPLAQQTTVQEGMKDMPILHPAKTYVVTGKEDWSTLTGFGTKTSEVTMMNLMMIGGSGMEHMRMQMGKSAEGKGFNTEGINSLPNGWQLRVEITPNPPKVGKNQIDLYLLDANGKPVPNQSLQATVEMTNMSMGVDHPTVKEQAPGHYALEPTFSMLGPWRVRLTNSAPNAAFRYDLFFDVGAKTPWQQPQPWQVTLTKPLANPQIGKNTLEFQVLDPQGNPIKGAKVDVTVAMTNMNMGTAHPKVTEKEGVYTTTVEFSMLGPWRVTLRVTPPKAKPFTQSFDFEVKENN